MQPICFITPNNFQHKAGDGLSTRHHNVSLIHPSLVANPGSTQATYLLLGDLNVKYQDRMVIVYETFNSISETL